MPRVGSSKIKKREPANSQRATKSFCWLPPESEFAGACGDAHFTFICAADSRRLRRFLGRAQNIFHSQHVQIGQRDVPEARQFQAQTGAFAIFGQQRHAVTDGIGRRINVRRFAIDANFAGRSGLNAKNRPRHFRAARAHQSRHAHNFARAEFQSETSLHAFRRRKILHLHAHLADRGVFRRKKFVQFAPDHVMDDGGNVQFRPRARNEPPSRRATR